MQDKNISREAKDKAGDDYWEGSWKNITLPPLMNPYKTNIGNTIILRFHKWFKNIFEHKKTEDMKLLEVGCGASAWLPYFCKEYGFTVEGIDYTDTGCEQSRLMLEKANLTGTIIKADMFSPPEELIGKYDVVVSFGLVEHFSDTTEAVKAVSNFAKPNGLVITSVPFMGGITGLTQKLLDRKTYDIHEVITKERLKISNIDSGLELVECDYFVSNNFAVCNLNGIKPGTINWLSRKAVLAILARVSMFVWFIERLSKEIAGNRWTSPFVNSIAVKKY